MKTSIKILLITFLFSSVMYGLNVSFYEKPENCQLYPRDNNNDGNVKISGKVLDKGLDSMIVVVYRNWKPFNRFSCRLLYQNDSAKFNFDVKIPAELAEFNFQIMVDTTLVARADSVVAGDVYMIDGQSNASTLGDGELFEFVRSYRFQTNDTGWCLGKEGTWGQEIGSLINNNYHIPVCFINGGVGSTGIGEHFKGTSIYKSILSRAVKGKVVNDIKAIFWNQGEANSYGNGLNPEQTYIPTYINAFDTLLKQWLTDYPNVQNVYVFQIGQEPMSGTSAIREAIRRIPRKHSNVKTMVTVSSPQHGNHFGGTGYRDMGQNMYRLVARDFYGSADTVAITPPNLKRAFYTSSYKDHIALEFDQPVIWTDSQHQTLRTDTVCYMRDYIALDTTWMLIDSGWSASGNRIILKLKSPSNASTITYLKNAGVVSNSWDGTGYWPDKIGGMYDGPYLRNSHGIGAFTFLAPIELPRATDTVAVSSVSLKAEKSSLALFESLSLKALTQYSNGITDTNQSIAFVSRDTFVVKVSANGVVRGLNSGTTNIVASRNGFCDSLQIVVRKDFTQVTSIYFTYKERQIMVGDSLSIGLTGSFIDGSKICQMRLDTFATYEFDQEYLQNNKLYVKASGNVGNTKLIALFGGQKCTLDVRIAGVPSFIKRINFQPKGEKTTRIAGWHIDSMTVYSSGKGFGWVSTTGVVGRLDSYAPNLERNYFMATMHAASPEAAYRIDCPDGKYVIRSCVTYCAWIPRLPFGVRLGSDTLALNIKPYNAERNGWVVDTRITVSGGQGLTLNIQGGIAYIILKSDDGAEMSLAAKDNFVSGEPKYTTEINSDSKIHAAKMEKPVIYPNPFNPSTTIKYSLEGKVSASFTIYTVAGKLVKTFDLSDKCGINRSFIWDGKDGFGQKVATGLYMSVFSTGNGDLFKQKMLLVK
ncbi:MAG: T9SS type A sorting domain-containing protein [Fibrobacteres bacterium]|nr:T9SS type A sorting domain-containing protein [Fibrobacterota bacterium]